MSVEFLNIVNEDGIIIGKASRDEIHKKGLLHREIHVWLYTPKGEIIFQHRAKDKDTAPDLLDASIGGHVEIGMDWEDSAIKELEEESGILASPRELIFIGNVRSGYNDPSTGTKNNALRREYALLYNGRVDALRVEKGKSQGFEAWPISLLLNMPKDKQARFIPLMLEEKYLKIYRQIQDLV